MFELLNAPNGPYWRDWAFIYEKADNLVEKALAKKRRKKNVREEDD